eukprot:gnl/TRDRNA2_/TRDRNA2_35375_c0_seq1.p1 gnl/TRDRNA2_/TRDRNA2_35375_c0~~gnl/TRDRNA2_/TRDRNA2_35375_c0_seq1.p1  ORF type:complete len:349 (+),score=80.79 gnl/TRDRNA2_/TRDRNA2_35375_c0_seq1:53-1099(+)
MARFSKGAREAPQNMAPPMTGSTGRAHVHGAGGYSDVKNLLHGKDADSGPLKYMPPPMPQRVNATTGPPPPRLYSQLGMHRERRQSDEQEQRLRAADEAKSAFLDAKSAYEEARASGRQATQSAKATPRVQDGNADADEWRRRSQEALTCRDDEIATSPGALDADEWRRRSLEALAFSDQLLEEEMRGDAVTDQPSAGVLRERNWSRGSSRGSRRAEVGKVEEDFNKVEVDNETRAMLQQIEDTASAMRGDSAEASFWGAKEVADKGRARNQGGGNIFGVAGEEDAKKSGTRRVRSLASESSKDRVFGKEVKPAPPPRCAEVNIITNQGYKLKGPPPRSSEANIITWG